jgi:hypothetical protein
MYLQCGQHQQKQQRGISSINKGSTATLGAGKGEGREMGEDFNDRGKPGKSKARWGLLEEDLVKGKGLRHY